MAEHSKEPWDALQLHAALGANVLFNPIIDCGNHVVAEIFCKEPNVLRIVACVNAMAGVPDPEKLMNYVRASVKSRECNNEHEDWHDAIASALEGDD